ncbi:ABC transporter ATP-binding protein [Fibrobacter sp.]|uniref:ATP-binding cassette domain-containing protein n=1 Tax=Fibrobacter sp. TaxID=35828 RepID=UPI0025BDDC6A|nr:ABC transporter ATP-binding protein [Fibrobacter sp.]MBR4008404.1 ABC transporter ATP-binding protein [Fibrobacter sp.]
MPLALMASLADAGLLWGIRSFMGLLEGSSPFTLWEWAGLMALLAALRLVFMFAKARNSETFLFNTGKSVTEWFLGRIRMLSPRLFHDGSGDAKVEAAYEATLSLQSNAGAYFQLVQALLQLAIFLPVLLYISWPLTLFLFAAVVPFVAWMQRRLHALGPQEESLLYARSNFRLSLNTARRLYRNWSGNTEIEHLAREVSEEAGTLNRKGLDASIRKNALSIAMETLSVVAMVAVLAFCAMLIARGWMDGTGLVLFCSALLLCYKPVKECARAVPQFRAAASACDVLEEFEGLPMRVADRSNQDLNGAADLVIAHGNFTYEGSGTPVYRDFGITLSREKPVLLRGQNGIGKSTLLRLLAGLEEWDAATRDTLAQSLPEKNGKPANVFFIPQDLELPPRRLLIEQLNSAKSAGGLNPATCNKPAGSSAPATNDNPAINIPKADLLANFARTAGTDRLLEKQGLSGGERSRIALLWALASDSPTVLLDEPMAAIALDDRERILLAFLDTAAALGKWVIMASHDPFSAAAQSRFNVVEMERAKG